MKPKQAGILTQILHRKIKAKNGNLSKKVRFFSQISTPTSPKTSRNNIVSLKDNELWRDLPCRAEILRILRQFTLYSSKSSIVPGFQLCALTAVKLEKLRIISVFFCDISITTSKIRFI